jgi:F-type H+-transporting ATPase subunit epsilon
MRLVVMTPEALVVDDDVVHVRAEDESGAFGILDRHADLLTALVISVLVYRDRQRREHFVAVRAGLLSVTGGRRVEVLTRDAVASDDLESLEGDVIRRFRVSAQDEARAQTGTAKLEGALLERVADYLHTQRRRGLGRRS